MAQFASYRVLNEIGRGSFGRVFLALGPQNEKRAFKEISLSNMNANQVRKAAEEAEMIAKLDSPFIIKSYGHFISGSTLTIVMEYSQEGSLHEYTRRTNLYTNEQRILDGLAQLVIGLSYLHGRRIVHRDISTVNILVMDGERLKISDFGIAKNYDEILDSSVYYRGNASFLAPELASRRTKQNYATDVWALGVVLFYMATAQFPYQGTDMTTIYYDIQRKGAPPIANSAYKKVQHLIDSILVVEPTDRTTPQRLLSDGFLAPFVQNAAVECARQQFLKIKTEDGHRDLAEEWWN